MTPVAIFVYNRPDTTRLTLEALSRNTLAAQTDVIVFSDGGKDKRSWAQVEAVRNYVRSVPDGWFKSLTLVERSENYYLERNITEGIAQVFRQYDSVVVLEDDIVSSPYLLQYMNDALTLYRDEPRVMHVAGFTFVIPPVSSDFYFTPQMTGYGCWATWRDRWQQHFRHFESEAEALSGMTESQRRAIEYDGAFPCLRFLKRTPIPWDICWGIAIRKADGLSLSPAQPLVRNIGLYQGTHFHTSRLIQWYEFDREPLLRPVRLEKVEPHADPACEAAFAHAIRDWGIRYTWLGRIARTVWHWFHGRRK